MQLNLINLSQGLIKHHGNWNTKDFVSVPFGWGTMVHSQGDTQTKRVFKGRCSELRGSASPLHMWYKVAPARGTKGQVTGTMVCRVTGRANNIIVGVKAEDPPRHWWNTDMILKAEAYFSRYFNERETRLTIFYLSEHDNQHYSQFFSESKHTSCHFTVKLSL